jgi:hypothetical protein
MHWKQQGTFKFNSMVGLIIALRIAINVMRRAIYTELAGGPAWFHSNGGLDKYTELDQLSVECGTMVVCGVKIKSGAE